MMKKLPGLPTRAARAAWLWPVAAVSVFGGLLGCPNEELAPVGPCTVSGVFDTITQNANDEVDLLFMVDNSGSMKEEQVNLAEQLPKLVSILASGKITNAAGEVIREFPPVKSLHLGVTTSDMGVNGLSPEIQGRVKCPGKGDDGLLLNTTSASIPTCAGKTFAKKYLEFNASTDDAAALGADFGCITNVGTNGCGFEQQLEAVYKALAPSTDISFSAGTGGHGDAENAGFLRPDSVIAVIAVSDEEDCSIPDKSKDLFNPGTGAELNVLNVKCGRADKENMGALHPASRYVQGLQKLRSENVDQVIFAAIVGVPVEAEALVKNNQQDFDGILALPDMAFREKAPDPSTGVIYPEESCLTANGAAFPPRRFVEVAKGFGKNGIIRSICQDDFSSALTSIIDKIADQLQGACLDRTLIADPDTGLAPCGLVEYLPASKTATSDCSADEGRKFFEMRTDKDGKPRVVCQINQLAVNEKKAGCDAAQAAGETSPKDCLEPNPNSTDDPDNPKVTDKLVGWYYDEFSAELRKNPQCNKQRIAFTEGAEQVKGSEIRFECLQPVFSVFADPKGVDAVNKPCEGNNAICKKAVTDEYPGLFCDPSRNTCQIQCNEDANCPDGWVCDKASDTPICLNPTCPPQ